MAKLPFALMPGSWGLKGPAREEAEAAYYLTGYELDRKLAEIRNRDTGPQLDRALLRVDLVHDRIDQVEFDLQMIALEDISDDAKSRKALASRLRHGDLTKYEHDLMVVDLDFPEDNLDRSIALVDVEHDNLKIGDYERDYHVTELRYPDKDDVKTLIALLDVDLKHGKITELAHAKECATLREEPWIGIVDQGFDADKGINGIYFEFDWNESWIVYLRMNGYIGASDEQVVDQWFSDVCRSQGVAPDLRAFDNTVIPFSGRVSEITSED